MLPNKNASPPCGNSFKLQTHDPKTQMDSMKSSRTMYFIFTYLDWLLFLCNSQLNNSVSLFNASPIFPTAWFTFPLGAWLPLSQTKFFIIALFKLLITHTVFSSRLKFLVFFDLLSHENPLHLKMNPQVLLVLIPKCLSHLSSSYLYGQNPGLCLQSCIPWPLS